MLIQNGRMGEWHAWLGTMINKEKPAAFYDDYYKRTSPLNQLAMKPIIKYVATELKTRKVKAVLDIGCGDGVMLEKCERIGIAGFGFDFSREAIKACRKHRGLSRVWVGDATKAENYISGYDAYLCLEVLEHIENDIGVIMCLRSQSLFIFSVPSWASKGSSHVRCFGNDNQIRLRYGNLIDIKSIKLFKTRRVVIGRIK